MKNEKKNKHTVEVIKPLPSPKIPSEVLEEIEGLAVEAKHQATVGTALVTIDGVLVEVKVHRRAKKSEESTDPMVGSGTWTVMRFDNPEIKKHPDYKALWKEVFFALGLNWNERGYVCEKRELQREEQKKDDCNCKKCEKRRTLYEEEREKRHYKPSSEPIGGEDEEEIPF